MSIPQDLKAQLGRQLRFLEWSAQGFEIGRREEAIRIATTLRVLFHHKKTSTSLLHHLKAEDTLMRSNVPDRAQQDVALGGLRMVGEFSWSLGELALSAEEGFRPSLDPLAPHRFIRAPAWWEEAVAVMDGVNYTRRYVVLHAADKDGGTHVDAKVPDDYEQLRASGALGSFEVNGITSNIEEAHYTFLRSMAFEVLHSPDLIALAR
jgi:hypothetical protein